MFDTLIKGGTIVDGLGGQPETGDVAVKDGQIAQVGGTITEQADQTIDADGAIVTPGFVDVHTHYDGQVSWDDKIEPSCSHGVTSVVMGNCGVGFAPVPVGGERELIDLMEGVEDIPGTALYEGIEWGKWETFPQYLDYLESRNFALNVGTQIPHGAVRNYVMGERGRANDPATQDDLAAMAQIVEEGLSAGALGFSTSRTIGHRSVHGNPVPGTFAAEEEIMAIAEAMQRAGRGVFEMIPSGAIGDLAQLGGEHRTTMQELDLMTEVSRKSGRPVTFTLVQTFEYPETYKEVLSKVESINQNGADLHPQVASRPIGLVTSLKTYHLFQRRETYLKIKHLPLEERLSEMRKPEIRAAILSDSDVPPELPGTMENVHNVFAMAFPLLFEIDDTVDYEPTPDRSFAVLAEAAGQDHENFMYDFLTRGDGSNFAIVLGSNFCSNNHDAIHEMLAHPETVTGLSDAGAHVNLIFDGVAPTYQLTHWARDRDRGERLPLEFVVAKQTQKNAQLYGLNDRGSLEMGKRADINVVDFDNLTLGPLQVLNDLPAGGSRILQPASGYVATFVNGVRTRQNDEDTGARPGRLLRG